MKIERFRPPTLSLHLPQMEYSELYPSSQDDQLEQAKKFCDDRGFHCMRPVTFVNAGMGSGKTRLMQCIRLADVTYILAPNETLGNQLQTAFAEGCSYDMVLLDGKHDRNRQNIEAALKAKKSVVVFFNHFASSGSDFGPSAKKFLRLIALFKEHKQLCMIDELDQQVTYLTGGLNPKLDHAKAIMKACGRILAQYSYSLNIFDALRANGVKCMCFSGTMNNFICSKLPSIGYSLEEISILNVAPMEYLYKNLEIIPIDMSCFDSLLPYLQELEAMPADKMGLLAFSTEKDIAEFLAFYQLKMGHSFSHIKLTSAADADDLSTAAAKEKLRTARYIIGINMVLTGFDLSTHIKGKQFALTVLYRTMSDKISQPLSKNPEHELHNEVAATMRQFIARARKGGKCLIPCAYYDIGTLYENLVQVFETIRDGQHEYRWVGPPRTSQVERHAQGLILALKQNLKRGTDRPVVEEIIADLAQFHGRNFRDECDTEVVDPYWIDIIQLLWEVYDERFKDGMKPEEFAKAKSSMIRARASRGPIAQKGNGFREGREINLAIEQEVKARAAGICAHCSEPIEDTEEGQIAHVHRHDVHGQYTRDNLVWVHKGCDGLYDNEHRFIHNPYGGYYLAKKYYEHKPDRKQWEHISSENILNRWNWAMKQMKCETEGEFIQKLSEKGYKQFT